MKATIMIMLNSNSILSFWNSMSDGYSDGITKRLLPVNAPLRIFSTYKYPENLCGIAFSFIQSINVSVDSFKQMKELSVQLLLDNSFEGNKLLIVQLKTINNKDVFACLCDNLIEAIQKVKTEKLAVKEVINRLDKWKALFEVGVSKGLTIAEQQGLYGELVFLHKLLKQQSLSSVEVLKTWVGPDKAMRDFQGNIWGVEVKTNSTDNANQIVINGKRQLDETLLNRLYLYVLSLEVSKMNGQTLNQKIDELRNLFFSDRIALNDFNMKLIEAGYYDCQSHFYDDRCYKQRTEKIYIIQGNFPRIIEQDLKPGINDISYSINISSCDDYLVSDKELFSYIIEVYHE